VEIERSILGDDAHATQHPHDHPHRTSEQGEIEQQTDDPHAHDSERATAKQTPTATIELITLTKHIESP